MGLWAKLLFHFLRFMDDVFPGWTRPPEPPADYLSETSFTYWMTKDGRAGRRWYD